MLRVIYNGPKEYPMMMEASAEEDEHKDYNNYNGVFSGGYTMRPTDQGQRRMCQGIDDRPGGLATIKECLFSLLSRC